MKTTIGLLKEQPHLNQAFLAGVVEADAEAGDDERNRRSQQPTEERAAWHFERMRRATESKP